MENYKYPHKHLIDIKSLSSEDISYILELSDKYIDLNRQPDKSCTMLCGRTVMNLFFENSARTRTSFELAGKRMGADVINMDVATSSAKKGETILDTARTLDAMSADFLIVRHDTGGAVRMISQNLNCSVINAGDGSNAHPTQALADALTIKRRLGGLEGVKVVIAGDIKHSRVARSNIELLNKMGAKVRIAAPENLLPDDVKEMNVEIHETLEQPIEGVDIVMMLRLQKERFKGKTITDEEYLNYFGLDKKKLAKAKDTAFVMHPGPINRGLEIDSAIADDLSVSLILEQVEAGVAVRQGILEAISKRS